MSERPLVVDGDGHVYEPGDLWQRRMDAARWGDAIPRQETVDGIYETTYVGGEVRAGGKEVIDDLCAMTGITPQDYHDMLQGLKVPGGSEPKARLVDMDADGIDAAVLYPSQALFYGPEHPIPIMRDVEFVLACQQAYNDWLADYCAAAPDRLFGMALVPLQSPGLAIAEAQRAIGDLGLRGICIRPSAYIDNLPLSHRVYAPFWSAIQELDVPIAFHPGVFTDTPGACKLFQLVRPTANITEANFATDEVYGGSGLGQAVGNAVDMIVSMGRVLMGGVCEKFPRLQFLFLEAGGGWIPSLLERMDEQVKAFPLERRWLSMLPSDYFRRQCYAGFEPEEWNVAACAGFLGADRILWASDYPHPEYHPGVVQELEERIESLSAEDRAAVLGRNAIAAYRLPLTA